MKTSLESFLVCCCLCKYGKFLQKLTVQVAAAPVKGIARLLLPDRLANPVLYIFHFCKGQLLFPVIEMVSVQAGRKRIDHRAVIPEDHAVAQVHIIIPDLFCAGNGVVEGSVQLVPGLLRFPYVPGVTIGVSVLRVCFADGDDTVDAKAVAEAFDRLGNSFAYTDPLLQWTDNFMGLPFFQLVVCYL